MKTQTRASDSVVGLRWTRDLHFLLALGVMLKVLALGHTLRTKYRVTFKISITDRSRRWVEWARNGFGLFLFK